MSTVQYKLHNRTIRGITKTPKRELGDLSPRGETVPQPGPKKAHGVFKQTIILDFCK